MKRKRTDEGTAKSPARFLYLILVALIASLTLGSCAKDGLPLPTNSQDVHYIVFQGPVAEELWLWLSDPEVIDGVLSSLSGSRKTSKALPDASDPGYSCLLITINHGLALEDIELKLWDNATESLIELVGSGAYSISRSDADRINRIVALIDPNGTSDRLTQLHEFDVLPLPDGWKWLVSDEWFAWEGEYPIIGGATVCYPLAQELARQHKLVSSGWPEFAYDVSAGYEAIVKRTKYSEYGIETELAVDLLLSPAPSDEETAMAKADNVMLAMEPVCIDSFVFFVNADNPVDSLTLDQVRGIYSGKITNWNQVGGNDESITAYQRASNSDNQKAMKQLVMNGTALASPPKVPPQSPVLLERSENEVAEYVNRSGSIGYGYRYYVDRLYGDEHIKVLKIEGVAPDKENVLTGTYPLAVKYFGVVREADGPQARGRKMLDWILSTEGQECVRQAGYLPIVDAR